MKIYFECNFRKALTQLCYLSKLLGADDRERKALVKPLGWKTRDMIAALVWERVNSKQLRVKFFETS